MAERKVTVLNPAGYQEQLPDTDNLLVSATPTANLHAVNKLYVDQGLANIDLSDIEADINAIESRLTTVEGDITTVEGDISTIQSDINTIETTYATKAYVDSADSNLQQQIDSIVVDESQTLQDVTDLGNTTTNDITSTGTITASVLVGDIDQGQY